MTPLTLFWVLCTSLVVVNADIEWLPGERPIDPSPYQFQVEEATRDDETKIEQLAYLLKEKQLSDEVKRTAAAAAIAAAREEGVRSAVDGNSDTNSDFAFGPDDERFFENDPPQKRPKPLVFENNDLEFDDNVENDDPSSRPLIQVPMKKLHEGLSPMAFIAIVAACCAAGVVAIVVLGVVSYRLQKNAKAAADVEYPAYGVTGPNKDVSPGSADRRLAQSAQMYHYQHQKQQIIAMERASNDRRNSVSDPESEDDNEEGDYTVYECPGLASTGEMEVKNPLFLDDPTPASPAKQPADGKQQELPK